MDNIRLLDLYRTSILSSQETLQTLSLLYRDGPKTEEEISKLLNFPIRQVKENTRRLFQSNLVEIVTEDKIAITKRASVLLSRLGITEIAAKSLVSDSKIPELDNTFLQACIEARSSVDHTLAKQYLHLLKSLDLTKEYLGKSFDDWDRLKSRLLFIFIVGMDPNSHQLGGREYCHSVIKWHSTKSSDLWLKQGKKILEARENFVVNCERALSDADTSFKTLIRDKASIKEKPSEITLLVTWSRVLSALLYNEPDPGLTLAFWSNQTLTEKVWEDLELLSPRVEMQFLNVLKSWGVGDDFSYNESETEKQTLIRKLFEVLGGPTSVGQEPIPFLPLTIASETRTTQSNKAKKISRVMIAWLRQLQKKIDSGEFDNLPLAEKAAIFTEVEKLGRITRRRFMHNPNMGTLLDSQHKKKS